MNSCIRFTFLFLCFITAAKCQTKITSPGEKLVKVFDKGYFTEGPAYSPDRNVYFSDITFTDETGMEAGIIWRYNIVTGKTELYRSPSGMANGIAFDPDGNMIICEGADYGGRRIIKTNIVTGKSKILAAEYNDLRFNSPNDIAIDNKGSIYFTDPRYVGKEKIEQPCFGVYRIDENSRLALIIDTLVMPNGIAINKELKKLYISVNFEGDAEKGLLPKSEIAGYDLSEDGLPFNGKIFHSWNNNVFPDGIDVDKAGNVYIAVRDEKKPGVYIYNKNSELVDIINTPEIPSNLTFGQGKDKNILFITAGGSLYKIKLLSEGI